MTNPCHNFGHLIITALGNCQYTDALKSQVNINESAINEFYNSFSNEFEHKKIGQELQNYFTYNSQISYIENISFVNLDKEKNQREQIIDKLKNIGIYMPIIFYTEGISSEFNYPLKVLHHTNLKLDGLKSSKLKGMKYDDFVKKVNQNVTYKLHKYYVLKLF